MWNFPLAPPQASEQAAGYDAIFYVILALTVFFTVAVMSFVLFFAIKYRVGSKANRERPQHENLKIEIMWSLPPLILGVIIFAWGAIAFVNARRPPANALEIFVIGKQWMWHIQHKNGVRENNTLHVPQGVPVKITMISQDVLHALYLPAFRVQRHVEPGQYTQMWFTPTKPGKYYMFCAMHCGTQHSEMGGYVYVMPQNEYAEWLANGGTSVAPPERTMVQAGQRLYKQLNCANCHTEQDTPKAPSLYGLPGKLRKMQSGATRVADDAYLRSSLLNPYEHIVSGYINTMPTYKAQLTEEQVLHLIAYMKTLGGPAATTQSPTAMEREINLSAAAQQPNTANGAQGSNQ